LGGKKVPDSDDIAASVTHAFAAVLTSRKRRQKEIELIGIIKRVWVEVSVVLYHAKQGI
jgi:hypothetical protein